MSILDVTARGSKVIHGCRGKNFDLLIKSVDEVILSRKEKHDASKEIVDCIENVPCLSTKYVPNEVTARYKFSIF